MMARLNFEDAIYRDIRFTDLVLKLGDIDRAVGALVRAWALAQTHYLSEETDRQIPINEWKKQRIRDEVLGVGLATVSDCGNFIRVSGADEQFSWLLVRQAGGRAAHKRPIELKPTQAELKPTGVQLLPTSSSSSSSKELIHGDSGSPTPNWLAEIWNEHCGALRKIRDPKKLNADRTRIARARLKETPNKALWIDAIQRMARSPYCNGKLNKPGPHQNWRADFDFLLQPSRLDQALEGKWDSGSSSQGPHPFAVGGAS